MKLTTVLNRALIAAGLLLSVNAFAQNTNADTMGQKHEPGCAQIQTSCDMPAKKAQGQKHANKKLDKQTAKNKRIKKAQRATQKARASTQSKRDQGMNKADMSGMSHPVP